MKETFTPGSGSDVPDSASDAGVNASEHAPSTTECPPMKVHINRKSYKEFTDMRSVQDLHAHEAWPSFCLVLLGRCAGEHMVTVISFGAGDHLDHEVQPGRSLPGNRGQRQES